MRLSDIKVGQKYFVQTDKGPKVGQCIRIENISKGIRTQKLEDLTKAPRKWVVVQFKGEKDPMQVAPQRVIAPWHAEVRGTPPRALPRQA